MGLNTYAQIKSQDDLIVDSKSPQSPAADHLKELNCFESGLPFLKNYTSREYQASGQNWAIIQDKNGFMYFGNTDGYVLQYDGVSWRKIPVSNGSIVRSLAIDSTGVIYVGAQNEFGYLAPDSIGSLQYVSLISRIDESCRNFGDVWQIHATKKQIYLSTRKYLFRWNYSGKFRVWKAETTFHASFYPPGRGLFIHQMKLGLMHLVADSLQLIPDGARFNNDWVYIVTFAMNNNILIGARKSGLFLFNGKNLQKYESPVNSWLIKNQIYHGITLQDSSHVLSTLRGGIIILDQTGHIRLVVNKSSGLHDENVWFVYEDNSGSIWLAMNKGIARIEYPSLFTIFDERSGLEGNVQDIIRHERILYAATGLGVYALRPPPNDFAHARFVSLPGLKSQCWSLLSLSDGLLVSCNHGIFEFKDNNFTLVTSKSAWILHRSKNDSNRIFLGLDAGLSSIYKKNNHWIDEGKIHNINVEARTIAEDALGQLWIGTVYEGVVRVNFNKREKSSTVITTPVISRYNKKNGLPSMKYNLVFQNGNDVIFGTSQGIYEFDYTKEYFLPIDLAGDTEYYKKDTTSYTIMSVGNNKDIWSNSGNKLTLARYNKNKSYYLEIKPFLGIFNASIYDIFPENNGVTWFGGTNGIIRYDSRFSIDYHKKFRIHIRRIQVNNDSLIFGGTLSTRNANPVLPFENNALRFEFASTCYKNEQATMYQYILDSFDQVWSGWSPETKKDYTNLPEDDYLFRVRAKNVHENISDEATFRFTILPPWYRTWLAYSVYLLCFLFGSYFAIRLLIDRAKRRVIAERNKIETIEKLAEEKMRSRVASDFHDELGNRITKISLFSEIIKNNFGKNSDKALEYLEKINENANNLYNETRDFIWHLDPQKDTLSDLITRFKTFGDELFDGTDILFKVNGFTNELKDIRLSMDCRQHILRIFKEGLHNSLKYSECKNVKISIKRNNNEVILKLCDDGVGFDISSQKEGLGLASMERRAQAINAALEILTKPGRGTEIILKFNLPIENIDD